MATRLIDAPPQGPGPAGWAGALASTMQLWPEEYIDGWDPGTSRLFLPTMAETPLGTFASIRITIRGTGIGATVTGPVVAARRIGGSALVPGVFLGLEGRAASAADYLERVARGQPVSFHERDPRYAVAWRLALSSERGRFWATTVNVSGEGCLVTWPGPALSVGEAIGVRIKALFAPTLRAAVCWSDGADAMARTAGLRLTVLGRAGRKWRSAVEKAADDGAQLV